MWPDPARRVYPQENQLIIWERETATRIPFQSGGSIFAFSNEGDRLAIATSENCRVFSRNGGAYPHWKTVVDPQGYTVFSPSSLQFNRDSRYLLLAETFHRPGGHVTEFDLESGRSRSVFAIRARCGFYLDHARRLCGGVGFSEGRWIGPVDFSVDEMRNSEGGIQDDAVVWERDGGFEPFAFTRDGRFLFASRENGFVDVFRFDDEKRPRRLAQLVPLNSGDFAILLPDGKYAGSPGGASALSFNLDGRLYPFEQFDLVYNRPDEVAKIFGAASHLVNKLAEVRQHRVRKLARPAPREGHLFSGLPEVAISNRETLPVSTEKRQVSLELEVKAGQEKVDRLLLYVNGVPLSGPEGRRCEVLPGERRQETVELSLAAGENRIEVSAREVTGAESFRAMVHVRAEEPAELPVMHVICIGVDEYDDPKFQDLDFSVKDAVDIAAIFASSHLEEFGEVRTAILKNREASREAILKIHDRLMETNVDDQVVIFFAGHGIRDEDFEYWFLTSDVDCEDPSRRGVSFREVEALFAGIPARRRLLLVDTCQAGEPGTDDVDPKLLDSIFADIRRGTGVTILASSTENTEAVESPQLGNGAFTSAVLEGIRDGRADYNTDKKVTVGELQTYVGERVPVLSRGMQTPTTRFVNHVVDFPVIRIAE